MHCFKLCRSFSSVEIDNDFGALLNCETSGLKSGGFICTRSRRGFFRSNLVRQREGSEQKPRISCLHGSCLLRPAISVRVRDGGEGLVPLKPGCEPQGHLVSN